MRDFHVQRINTLMAHRNVQDPQDQEDFIARTEHLSLMLLLHGHGIVTLSDFVGQYSIRGLAIIMHDILLANR